MKIAVIDGSGGGIGRLLIEKLVQTFSNQIQIIALGTNALATAAMLKAGANEGATGENALIWNVSRVQLIIGPISILSPNAMLGELTPKMATAISDSPAKKIVIPLSKWNVQIAGLEKKPLQHYAEDIIEAVSQILRGEENV